MTRDVRALIADGRVHVLDGAMGTELYARGMFLNVCYDELSVKRPDLVRDVHEAYLRAGAEVLETNTFGANPVKLSSHGLEADTEALNRAAATLAREVAGGEAAVVGAIGPLGIRIEPFGPTSRAEAEALFRRQVAGLVAGGVDGFVLETFADIEELLAAFRAVRTVSDLPVIAQITIGEEGRTAYGTDVASAAASLAEAGADVIGLNCSVGPAAMLDAVERMARVTDRPLSVQPNAGFPRDVGDRKIYLASPDYMARYALRLVEAGARFVGGCCGTTPEHISRIHQQVGAARPSGTHVAVSAPEPPRQRAAATEPVPLAHRSGWGRALAEGRFARSVEIIPPKGWRPDAMIAQCRRLREAGVDAVNVLDGPRAQTRMGVLPAALVILRDTGLEPIVHYTCRDRNMLGMISDLLGAAAAGIRNLLLVTGDAPTAGPYPDSTAVFDIDSIGLTNLVHRLNQGLDPGGTPLDEPTRFVIGVAVNPAPVDVARELKRFYWKVDAGAEFAVTQPVFDPDRFAAFVRRIEEFHVPVIASLWPLLSVRNAEFVANELPGIAVPDAVIRRMREADARGGQEASAAEGVAIAREVLECIRPLVAGVQVSAPLGRVEAALAVLA